MEILIEQSSKYGLVVSSRIIAEQLGKRHDNVVRDLEKISETSNVSSLIIPSTYKVDGQNRSYKEYLLTKDGFTLYMFNIQGFQEFKMEYIKKFNEMEKALKGVPLKTPSSQQKKLKFEPVKFYKSNGNDVVNARELWYFLQIKTTFLTWIKRRIEKFDFIEDEDFVVSGDKYLLMLDMAKELCTIENTSSSRLLRKYIRAFEKKEKEKLETSKKNKKLGYILTNNIALRTYAEKLLGIISGIDIGKPINSIDWWAIKHNCQQIKAYAYPIEVDKKYGVEQQGLITFEY